MVGAASLQWYRPLVTLGGIALVATMTLGFYTALWRITHLTWRWVAVLVLGWA